MPFLTPQQRSQVVAKAGLDPSLYDYDEDSAQWITKIPTAPIAPLEGPSNLESFGRGAAQSVIPTATGALGAVGLLGLAGSGIGTPAAIALALTGGLGGGYIGAKTQSAILPESFQARFFPREADITENPLATAAGGLAGSLPTFRPSVSALKTLGGASIKGLQNTLRPGAISLSMPEKAALVNTAIQGGIGGAVSVAEDLRLGHEINPTKAVLEAAGNVLFNKPTRFGQALGLTDVAPNTSRSIDLAKLEPTSEASLLTAGPKQTLTRPQEKLIPSAVDKNIFGRPSGKSAEASASAFTSQAISSRDKLVASRIRRPKPPEFNEKELIPGEYNPARENAEALQGYAETRQLVRDELDKRGITPTDERFNTLFKDLSQRFGLKPVIDATLQGPDGSAVAGKMIQDIFDRYLVAIRPAKDRVTLGRVEGDTGPHEVLHAAIEQMRTSPNPGTRRYIARLESQISKSPEYLAMKARHPELTPNEWLTQRGGLDYIRRTLKTKSPLSQVFDDVTSIIKERIGKASPEDLGRLMSRHLDYSPPIGERLLSGDVRTFRAFVQEKAPELIVNGTTEQEAGLIDDIVKKYEGKDTTLVDIDNDLKSAGITDAKYRAALTQAIVDKLPKQPTAFQRGEDRKGVSRTEGEIEDELRPLEIRYNDLANEADALKYVPGPEIGQRLHNILSDLAEVSNKIIRLSSEHTTAKATRNSVGNTAIHNIGKILDFIKADHENISNKIKTIEPGDDLNIILQNIDKQKTIFQKVRNQLLDIDNLKDVIEDGPKPNELNQPAERQQQASDYVTRLAAKSSELDIRRTAVDTRIGEVEKELSAIPIEDVNRRGALLLQLDNLHTENMALAESHGIIQKQLGLIETGTLDQFERNQPAEWGGDSDDVYSRDRHRINNLADELSIILREIDDLGKKIKVGDDLNAVLNIKKLQEEFADLHTEYNSLRKTQQIVSDYSGELKRLKTNLESVKRKYIELRDSPDDINYADKLDKQKKLLARLEQELENGKATLRKVLLGPSGNELNQPAEYPQENPIVERFEKSAQVRARAIIWEAQHLIKSGASLNSRRLVDLQNEIEGLGEIQAKLNGIIPPEELNQPADFNGVDTSRDQTFYQPATANTLQPVAVSKPHFFGGLSFIRPLASAVDKLRLKSWESVGAARSSFLNVANAVKNWDAWQSALQGRLINEPLDTLFRSKVPKSEYPKALRAYETYAQTGKRPENLSQQVNDVFNQIDIFARRVRSLQRAVGMPTLGLKNRVVDTPETFAPFVLNDKALLAFTENVGSEDFFRFKKLWKNHLVKNDGITPDEANALVENYVSSLGGKEISKVEFNALRRTEGISLPEELRETDLVKVINKIGRRASQDLAYFRYFQNDFKTAAALGIPDAISGNKQRADGIEVISSDPNVRNALKFITNDFVTVTNPRITSAARAVSNSLLGFGTGLRDIAAIPALALPYMRTSDYKSFISALKNLKDARKQSLIYNARSNQMDFNRWKTLENPDRTTDIFNRFAEIMRRGQGREMLEQGARIYSFALGKELAKTNTLRALAGDSAAIDWFKKFGTLLDIKDKSSIAKLTEDDLNQVAKNFVDRHQGTYGPRGLPAGAFEGPLSPWMALSRWSIEKSNIIYKDVIRPAIDKGNYIPLLHYTLGTMLTGVAIRELNEFLSGGRRPQDASFREALAAESPEDVVAAAIITAQLGAWAGIVGDSARWMSDAFIRGEMPSGLTFPLVDFFTDKLVQGTIDYRNAVEAGANPTKALFGFFGEVAKGGIQNVRLAHYWANPSEVDRKNAFRDIRTFKQLNDEPVPQLGTLRTNPLLNKDLKEFKRAETVEEAVSFLPNLIEQAVENANGDPYKLKAELRRIKQNSFQILPNPETMPISFAKMLMFLEKTQGKEAAKQRLSKYFVQNIVNQQKAELVP